MRYFFLIVMLSYTVNSLAQVVGGKMEKLEKIYAEGKYETCLFKADNYSYKEEYTRNPEPLLYISMCFYQLAIDPDLEIQDDYPDALRQSIKYAARFVRKDKTDELYSQNIEYLNQLKTEQQRVLKDAVKNKKSSSIASAARLYNSLNRDEDQLIKYMIGVHEVLSRNYSQGTRNINAAMVKIEEDLKAGNMKIDTRVKEQLIDSFLKYSEYLVKEKNIPEAKIQIDLAKQVFPNDGYITMQANMINKAINKN